MQATEQAAVAAAPAKVSRRTWLATAIMLIAVFMELMDVTMTNVAVPSIREDLGATAGQLQWIVAGYSLAFAVALMTGGRLGDIWGRKKAFLSGLIAFTGASLLSGAAPSAGFLIGSRVLQGLAAAVMLPQVLASISVAFPAGKQRDAVFGLFGAVVGLGGVVAPVIGGTLIGADLFSWGWRPIFLINIPIGVVAFAAALKLVSESTAPARPRLDLTGAVTGALGMFLLVFPVIEGREDAWPAWGWVLLALAAPVFAAFILIERRRPMPIADLSLFRRRGFGAGLLVTLVFFAGVTSTAFVLMIYLQSGFGYGPVSAGLSLLPLALALVAGSGISIVASRRLGRTVLQAGALIAAGGVIWLAAIVGGHPAVLDVWDIVPPLAVTGLGLGLTVAPLTDFTQAGVPEESAGSASGLQSATIQVGNAVGVAVLGAIFFSLLGDHPDHVQFASAMRQTLYYSAGAFAAAATLVFAMAARPNGGTR